MYQSEGQGFPNKIDNESRDWSKASLKGSSFPLLNFYMIFVVRGRGPLDPPGATTEYTLFLPPANEVCEGYVFTGVCLSAGGGGMRGCLGGRAWLLWGQHVWLL